MSITGSVMREKKGDREGGGSAPTERLPTMAILRCLASTGDISTWFAVSRQVIRRSGYLLFEKNGCGPACLSPMRRGADRGGLIRDTNGHGQNQVVCKKETKRLETDQVYLTLVRTQKL